MAARLVVAFALTNRPEFKQGQWPLQKVDPQPLLPVTTSTCAGGAQAPDQLRSEDLGGPQDSFRKMPFTQPISGECVRSLTNAGLTKGLLTGAPGELSVPQSAIFQPGIRP